MRKLYFLLVSLIVLGCSSPVEQVSLDMEIKGMSCGHSCAPYLQKQIKATEGVLEANVSFEDSSAHVTIDKNVVSQEELIKKINGLVEGKYNVESCTENKEASSSQPEKESSTSNDFDITDPNVSTSSFKLPNIFKVLTTLLN